MVYALTDSVFAIFKNVTTPEKKFSCIAYVVRGIKNILIDTLPERESDMFFRDLDSILDGEAVDAVIQNRSDAEHSGLLDQVLEKYPSIPLYCNALCRIRLAERGINSGVNWCVVRSKGHLDIGEHEFVFYRMPGFELDDNMVTWCADQEILFTCGMMGQDYSFDIPVDCFAGQEELCLAAERYYDRIFRCTQKKQIISARSLFESAVTQPIEMIAPGHGVIIQKYKDSIVNLYRKKWGETAGAVHHGMPAY